MHRRPHERRRLIALLLGSGVTGALACSSGSTPLDTPDASEIDAGKEAGAPSRPVASQPSSGPVCPSRGDIDVTSYPWKPPTIATGSCTANEIDALVSYIASHGSAGAPDWETNAGVGASCVKCVFGFNGPTWPPFVEQNDHQLGELNVGGCIAIASSSEACGRAYQHRFDCLYEACADCPADQGVVDSCLAAAPSDACRTASLAVVDACPNLDAAESACAGRTVYEGAIRAQCGAGVDGGVADAAAE